MYKYKVHCRNKEKRTYHPVFIEIPEKSKEKALEAVAKSDSNLKPRKAYFVCEVSEKASTKRKEKEIYN